MSAPARKSGSMPSGSSLKGPKFGATLDLLRVMSSNLFKLDTMLKVHDEADIELRAKLIEALDGVRKLVAPIDAKTQMRITSPSMRPHAGSASIVSVFRQSILESMKEVQGKMIVVQEAVRLKQKDSATKLQAWISQLREANALLEAAIVSYEKSHMQVKLHYSLYLNLIEAKISATVDSLAPNPYVEVWIDAARRSRTRALWVDEAPVWNQTFDLMIPTDAEEVTFKLYSESKDGLADPTFLGKSELLVSALKARPLSSEWTPFFSRGVGHVTEASTLHAIIKYKPGLVPGQGSLTVVIVEAKKLVEDGSDVPSPYCRISIIDQGVSVDSDTDLKKKDKDKSSKDKSQKTSVQKKNDSPHWEEGFVFKFSWDSARSTKLLIEVHDDRQSKNTFMGAATIPLDGVVPDSSKDAEVDRWFKLKRRNPEAGHSPGPQVGQLKLDLQYREERLLPDTFYDPLFNMLQEDHLFLINLCFKTAQNPTARKEMVKSLVGAFEMKNKGAWLLKRVSDAEVAETWDLSVLFRGNSVASSCLDAFMKTVGRQVLDATMRPILRELYKSTKSCELDPNRTNGKGSDVKKNLNYFMESLTWIWEAIQSTVDKIPMTMRRVLGHLRSRVSSKWPNDANSRYTSVTSFLFLRFFCPALMTPQTFDLVDEIPPAQVGRNLALLSKTLMNLANFVPFGTKEPSMSPLNDWLSSNFDKMKSFIDRLVDDPEASDVPIVQNSNATLFIFAREMNHIREFLSSRAERLRVEKELAAHAAQTLAAQAPKTPEVSSKHSHHSHERVDKHHNSDDEDDVVDGPAARKQFKRVSSKSRLAAEGLRTPTASLMLTKEGANDPNLLQHYQEHLSQTLVVLDALNSTIQSCLPVPTSPKVVSASSAPALFSKEPSSQTSQPLSSPPGLLTRGGSLEGGILRKRGLTGSSS